HPPKVGPIVGAMTVVMPNSANASPRFSGGNVSARIACAMGCNPPPPAPCSTRKRMIAPRLGAAPQRRELRVKIARQIMKNCFRPKIPANQPVIGSTMALDTRYDVKIQVLSSLLAPRLPAMWGRATFAMLVSRTSMKAAMATRTATSHGLTLGLQVSLLETLDCVVSTVGIGTLRLGSACVLFGEVRQQEKVGEQGPQVHRCIQVVNHLRTD